MKCSNAAIPAFLTGKLSKCGFGWRALAAWAAMHYGLIPGPAAGNQAASMVSRCNAASPYCSDIDLAHSEVEIAEAIPTRLDTRW